MDVARIDRHEALIAIATYGGMSQAAVALGITISALIKRIKVVESKAGVRLVVRRPGVGENPLTRAGRILLDHAERVIAADRAFNDAVARLHGSSPHGRIADNTMRLGGQQSDLPDEIQTSHGSSPPVAASGPSSPG